MALAKFDVLVNNAQTSLDAKNYVEAVKYANELAILADQLSEKDLENAALGYGNVALIMKKAGKIEEANSFLNKSLNSYIKLAEKKYKESPILSSMACNEAAELAVTIGDKKSAISLYAKSADYQSEVVRAPLIVEKYERAALLAADIGDKETFKLLKDRANQQRRILNMTGGYTHSLQKKANLPLTR